jgi:hypothetical protein
MAPTLIASAVQAFMLNSFLQLALTVVICVLTIIGYSWARVFSIARGGFGCAQALWITADTVGEVTVAMEEAGDTAVGKVWLFFLIMLLISGAFAASAAVLAFNKNVQEHFYNHAAKS